MTKSYTPERNHIVLLDFDPTKGNEIGKYRPALVLSSIEYNKRTGLIIFCPISTSILGGISEVVMNNLEKPSVVAASLIQPLSCKERKVKFLVEAESSVSDLAVPAMKESQDVQCEIRFPNETQLFISLPDE